MKKLIHRLILIWCLACSFTACVNTEKPTSFLPEVWVNEAENVTRHSAELSGGVRLSGESTISVCRLLFGTSEEEMREISSRKEGSNLSAQVEDLKSGTEYYYCLEAGNGRQQVRSEVMRFSTEPDGPVKLGEVSLVGRSPVSLWVSCPITDNGGGEVFSVGFAYRAASEAKDSEISTKPGSEQMEILELLPSLQKHTEYIIRAFAENSRGRSYSEELRITTDDAVTYPKAGDLSKVIGEKNRYTYTTINIQSPMNGDDFRFLRSMAGCGIIGESATAGRLEEINLSGATIVEGGISYDGSRFTKANVVTAGLFSDMTALKNLVLPLSAMQVDEDAFGNCTALESVTLPLSLNKLSVSTGCTSLSEIVISEVNQTFATIDGLLYNKAITELLWCPRCIKAERLTLPATLTHIKKYTFEGCAIGEIVLPETVTLIDDYAFAKSEIKSIVLPDKLSRVDEGLFSQCSSLKKVTLGSEMSYICDYAFNGTSLEELYVQASYPPVCEDNAFAGIDLTRFKVYVPKKYMAIYRGHLTWGKLIIKAMTE